MLPVETNASNVINFYDNAARSTASNSLEYRRQTRIVHLRNFNNWTKSMLIGVYLEAARERFGRDCRLRVFDLCCGKGGDQMKWAQGHVDYVMFLDISCESVRACKQRYEQLQRKRPRLYSADFHVCDCTADLSDNVLRDRKFHLVSCQFSLHYAFESLPKALQFFKNVSCCLRPGGFFIATIPNAYEIVRRAKEAYAASNIPEQQSENDVTFGNSIYSIRFRSGSFSKLVEDPVNADSPTGVSELIQFPLLGARYDFHLEGVVDCPEFLIYPPLLNELASAHGLVPVSPPLSFAAFFHESVCRSRGIERPLDLLIRMNALETWKNPRMSYPENFKQVASDEPKAYAHAEQRVNEDEACRHSKFLGTISQAEWEVINLYSVVAFRRA
ncbi:mRNA cap guanine-N7 methyltransferase, variant 2 [Clonorchis sinensis]|uniref:mRNA cap guanine-N7 methyltransferase, variant 2 n=2 Tax=Clonorchis sinensis TaxID=79923 RepID=A0A8T1M5B4_CLOSI|nr:mRNA cap guanine-N7 methyltransferase, variant 2 [Clonorchis sinensis]GAA41291.2 mRNA (guanine-N7-)-methyltransferase [Clonorchis sinensis]